jgi:hypothetical protein
MKDIQSPLDLYYQLLILGEKHDLKVTCNEILDRANRLSRFTISSTREPEVDNLMIWATALRCAQVAYLAVRAIKDIDKDTKEMFGRWVGQCAKMLDGAMQGLEASP